MSWHSSFSFSLFATHTPLDPLDPLPHSSSSFYPSLLCSPHLSSPPLQRPYPSSSLCLSAFSLSFPSRQSFHSCHGAKILEICFQIISGFQLPTRLNLVGLPYTAGSRGLSRCARLPLLTSE
ncbi:unnamed protein product [Tuber melanosporum]|uniref:(Perigord truffle) hypothetical protein n=1 Tax=Tuber melanosporum (strain Mel28) TaxID=656061 RepID=D5G9X5_TUBMM|nr:uncharacterized protein GSTUM_00003419001 [Tuber melanosporum]CAZ81318.1 unnamed protein product [Tuber melanosporum]